MKTQSAVYAINALRRTEKEILRSTDWQDVMCREHQIDTAGLQNLIKEGTIKVPRQLLMSRHG